MVAGEKSRVPLGMEGFCAIFIFFYKSHFLGTLKGKGLWVGLQT
jgi:hypothetical protein